MADLGDAGEVFYYLIGFWAFVFNPKYRTRVLEEWQAASLGGRLVKILEGTIAVAVGIGIPVLIIWLIVRS